MANPMRHIALINQKGGVGKTTTTANLGAALALTGRRVLLVDMDPQGHLTMHLGVDPASDDRPTIYEVLTDNVPLAEAVRPTSVENVRVVPATIDLAAAEVELVGVVGREVILRDALAALRADAQHAYDYLLIDCPPSLGLLTLNALSAVEEVMICLQPHFLALQGVGKLLETVALVQQRINAQLRVSGVVLCMYDIGTRLAGEVVDDLTQFLDQYRAQNTPWSMARVFQTTVRRNIKLAECPSFGQVIFQYAPGSHGAADYSVLAEEVIAMEPAPAAEAAAAEPEHAVHAETSSADESADGPAPNCGRGLDEPLVSTQVALPEPVAAAESADAAGTDAAPEQVESFDRSQEQHPDDANPSDAESAEAGEDQPPAV